MTQYVQLEHFHLLAPDSAAAAGRPVLDRLKSLEADSSQEADVLVPALLEGEQYRFHFDMTRCIGCRCCEVACNEQNNNPAHVTWRRVGEIEGGDYPHVQRLHLSMACNHCLEPSCLEGCPVDAYTKLSNGIVKHDAETCIGCQYCTWNCPYGVPQFHPERRVVTKCHLCVDRLAQGELPACVEACPTSAIQLEKVNVADWRKAVESGQAAVNGPGLPAGKITGSTTRITLPDDFPESMGKRLAPVLAPEAPHTPLVFLLVLSQWSVGLFGASLLFELVADDLSVAGQGMKVRAGALAAIIGCFVGQLALGASIFHLGRPVFALRAMKAWRHSWLSREAVLFFVLATLSLASAGALITSPGLFSMSVLSLTIASGLAGITASAVIYLIPARPAWHTWRTPAQFFLTMLLLGSAGGLVILSLGRGDDDARAALQWTFGLAVSVAALCQALIPWTLIAKGYTGDDAPVRRTALLLTRDFARLLWIRTVLLLAIAVIAPASSAYGWSLHAQGLPIGMLVLALFSEMAGRYLFFVTVVPLDMPGHFFSRKPGHARATAARSTP